MFHAGDGDCLLLTSTRPDAAGVEQEYHVLVDGGRKEAFRDNARRVLYALPRIDLAYVSHIDDDHISGVLGITEDAVQWKVYRHLEERGESPSKPSFPEPPPIEEIWHNSLFELVGDDLEPDTAGALATSARLLAGAMEEEARLEAQRVDDLATGERSAMELSRRISDRQLGIKRNRPRNRLMQLGNSSYRRIGPFTLQVLAPTEEAITALRADWAAWIRNNHEALKKLQAEMLVDEGRLGALDAHRVVEPLASSSLGSGGITPPNLASLMLFVRDRQAVTVLLAGDGSSEDVLAGLEHYGRLDDSGRIHVSALKVQHHGAVANVSADFVDRVTADHYLFCGNGAHHNPERDVIEAFAAARLGIDRMPIWPNRDFHFWFSSRRDSPGLSAARQRHMEDVEDLVAQIKLEHDPSDRFHFAFLQSGHHDITIP